MQIRAWFFGLLGVVFLATGLLWYEIRKSEMTIQLSEFTYNPATDSAEKFRQALDGLTKHIVYYYELEEVRFAAVLLSLVCFFLAWRNSIGHTHQRMHDELLEAIITHQPIPNLPQLNTAVNTWQQIREAPAQTFSPNNWNDLTPEEQHMIRIERGRVHSYDKRVLPPENRG